jgi:proline dehydrogenase
MLRSVFLWLSEQRRIFEFVKQNGFARKAASRFVAGEATETAIEAARVLNAKGITVSLDLLGESVSVPDEAYAARDEVLTTIDEIDRAGIDGNVSVKLTQMGLDIDVGLCLENMRAIMSRARQHGMFVRIDMESSEHTERTLGVFAELHPEYGDLTGVVIQSYLRRSAKDIEDLLARGARVRLCKGAYSEPATVAFQQKSEIDASYVRITERLLDQGNYPALATHDEDMIQHAMEYVDRKGIPLERFEFQMLYGVRRDLQHTLREKGYNMRVYVPFGSNWYPYLMRRLAEKPGNAGFMLASVVKETFSRR